MGHGSSCTPPEEALIPLNQELKRKLTKGSRANPKINQRGTAHDRPRIKRQLSAASDLRDAGI